jgi:hypothetical protein
MRRFLVVTVLLSLFISVAGQRNLKFHVHADPQFAWLRSDDENVESDGSILHIQTGLQMDLFFDRNYAFVLGVGVNNLGGNLMYADSTELISKGDTLDITPGQSVKHNLQYIDIPLGLKLKTEELGYATFFLQVGFNPMININAYATTQDGTLDKESIQESTHLFNLGYHAGIGVEYRLGGSTAAIGGIRWTSGLTDVTSTDKANVNINSLSIHLGILF